MQESEFGFRKMKIPYFTYKFSAIIILMVIITGFDISSEIKYPEKKVNKQISKTFDIDNFELKLLDGSDLNNHLRIFDINIKNYEIGNLIINRVFSCREGGCSADINYTHTDNFEYFDYFMILDTNGTVLVTNIYNYQATKGHEVMSRGWLKQFNGHKGNNQLNYGKEIDAISGATISATAFVEEVKYVTKTLAELK